MRTDTASLSPTYSAFNCWCRTPRIWSASSTTCASSRSVPPGQFGAGQQHLADFNAGVKGVSTVDTEVDKQIILDDGPYAHRNMVLLTPLLGTLPVTDQRRKPRTRINVPVTALLPAENYSEAGSIVDISESEMRIRLRGNGVVHPRRRHPPRYPSR